jgi:hypothetical protein
VEPAPDTVTVPCAPVELPMNPPPKFSNVPPFWITSFPVPLWPTARFRTVAFAPLITVEFGVAVSMFALVSRFGTPAFQLAAVNQSDEDPPFQLVWARVDTVDAESNAITAVVVSKCVRIDAPAKRTGTSSKPTKR